NHDLMALPKFETYRGLMFGCLNKSAPDLVSWLGDTRFFVDLVMEQGPHGMEFVPGRSRWVYAGNWKLQIDNSDDCYHLGPAHTSFTNVLARRRASNSQSQVKMPDWEERLNTDGGMYTFTHGHSLSWIRNLTPSNRPIHRSIDEIRRRVGEPKAHWMLQNRN